MPPTSDLPGKNLKHRNFKPESLNAEEPEAVELPAMSTEAKQAILGADEEG